MLNGKSKMYVFKAFAAMATSFHSVVGYAGDLAIAVDTSVLNDAFSMGSQQIVTPINKYANGVWTNGSAVTSADVQVAPWQNDGTLGLQLNMSSYTNGSTYSQTLPRPSIVVEFNASIESWGATSKTIGFNESGFFSYPAQSQVQTSITFADLQSSAWGLFWRLKERIAYQRAYEELMNQKAQQEFEASQEVASQLQMTVDQRSDTELSRLNQLYFETIYQPYVANSLLQGRLRFATEGGRFLIGSDDLITASQLPATSASEPVSFAVGPALIKALLSKYVAGKQMSGEDILRALLPSEGGEGLDQDVDFDALRQISLVFSAQSPVEASTDAEGITITLHLVRLRDGATTGENLKVGVRALISEEDDSIIVDLDQPIEVESANARPISDDLREQLQAIVRKVVPAVTVDLTGKSLNVAGINLAIGRLKVTPTGLFVALKRGRGVDGENGASIPGTPPGKHADLCTQAGGTWRNASECDCNRMWFTQDAMTFYEAAEFSKQCQSYL